MLSDSIKQARKLSGLSKAEVARRLNIPYTTYNNYEIGFSEPKFDMLQRIADVLHCSLAVLITFDTSNYPNEFKGVINFNEYLYSQGYEVVLEDGAIFEEDGNAFLIGPEGVYKIQMSDFIELQTSTESFLRFKINELINKSDEIRYPNEMPTGPRFLSPARYGERLMTKKQNE